MNDLEEPKVRSRSDEEPCRNQEKSTVEEEPMNDLVKSPSVEEPNVISVVEKVPKTDKAEPPCREGDAVETPIIPNDSSQDLNASLEQFLRRFTRSSLKPKESVDITGSLVDITETVSGNSAVSDDTKSESIVNAGGSCLPEEAKTETNENGEGNTSHVVSPLMASPKRKLEMKMSKKIALTKFPTRVMKLLETGMLEGSAMF